MGQLPKIKCRTAEAFSMPRTTASITLVLVQSLSVYMNSSCSQSSRIAQCFTSRFKDRKKEL